MSEPEPISDDLFAQTVRQHMMATEEQIDSAQLFQQDSGRKGQPISLAEALVKLGVITLAQRDNVEQRLRAQQKTGLARLLHYKLLQKIGEGAMGAVYLAEDERLGRKVAIKVLPRSAAARAGFIQRFQREADAAGRLNHPNLVRAFSFGEDQGWYFFVMEYCDGETQDKRLKRGERVSVDEATAIVLQVARALQYAHERGVIHRDVKPSNIMLASDGTAKILDLGLSKNLHDEKASFLTQSGMTVGTPHYMAPEQARGDPDVDGRADIYALGATLYHFVSGDTPFHGSSAFEIVTKHMSEELHDPRDIREDIPDGLVDVIRTMMAKRKEDRYADCAHLIADLERVLRGEDPRTKALAEGKSSVRLPRVKRQPRAARPARTGVAAVSAALRGPRRGRRPNAKWTVYAIAGGLAIAVLIPLVIVLAGSSPPAKPPKGRPGPERPVPPKPTPPKPKPKPKPVTPVTDPSVSDAEAMRKIREASARRQFEDLQKATAPGSLPPREIIRRYEGFVSSYGDTEAGQEAKRTLEKLSAEESLYGSGPVTDEWLRIVGDLSPEQRLARVVQKLRAIHPDWVGEVRHEKDADGIVALDLTGAAVRDLSPLRALKRLRSLTCTQTLVENLAPLKGLLLDHLVANRLEITSLEPLRGMPLKHLDIYGTKVASLEPVRGVPLSYIGLDDTPVSDLGPLEGAPLEEIHLRRSRVLTLTPLRGMPLRVLRLDGTRVSDLGPVQGCPLEHVTCAESRVLDLTPLKGAPLRILVADHLLVCQSEFLVACSTLKSINEDSAAEFWSDTKALRAFMKGGPVLPADGVWAKAVELLPLIKPAQDAVAGTWTRRGGGWGSDDTTYAKIEIPWRPPSEYDLRVEFTRVTGTGDVDVILAREGVRFSCQMGAYKNQLFGFCYVDGDPLSANLTRGRLPDGIMNGRRHTAVILVRDEGLKLFLDGRLLSAWPTDYDDLTPSTVWRTRGAPVLGLGSYKSPVTFHRVAVRQVTGTGRPYRRAAGASPPAGAAAPAGGSTWTPLFGGRSLAGWSVVGNAAPRIEEDALVLDGAEVQRTVAAADFDLAGAVKLVRGTPQNVGCISFRRRGSSRGGTRLLFHMDGDVHLLSGGERLSRSGSKSVPARQWHPFRLSVKGRTLELEVGGRLVMRGAVPAEPAGKLALFATDAGAVIAFKDLRLRAR